MIKYLSEYGIYAKFCNCKNWKADQKLRQPYRNKLVTVIHSVLLHWLDGPSCPALVLSSDSDHPCHNQALHLYSIAHIKMLCFPLLAKVLTHPLFSQSPLNTVHSSAQE